MRISKSVKFSGLAVALLVCMTGAGMAGQQATNPVAGQANAMPGQTVSLDRAGQIALEQVPDGTVVSSDYRFKDGRGRYKILVVDGDARVELKIDASSGQVVSLERKPIESVKYPKNWGGQAMEGQGGIDTARAREIALARTGGGTVVELEKEFKRDGRIEFEIDIVDTDRKYELTIDGQSGAIIEYQDEAPKRGYIRD